MLDSFTESAQDADVSIGVKNLVVLALWVPIILVLWGIGIAMVGIGLRLALFGTLPDPTAVGVPVDPTLVGIAVVGGLGYLYLMLANETFGEATVEAATEQAQEIRNEVEDE